METDFISVKRTLRGDFEIKKKQYILPEIVLFKNNKSLE